MSQLQEPIEITPSASYEMEGDGEEVYTVHIVAPEPPTPKAPKYDKRKKFHRLILRAFTSNALMHTDEYS